MTDRPQTTSETISVLSAGPIGLESGRVPIRFLGQILIFTIGAVLLVHLFLRADLTLVQLAAHAVALSTVYTLGFAAAYAAVGSVWSSTRSLRLPKSAFIWTVGICAVGFGLAISEGLQTFSVAFGETVNAHEDTNSILRLMPLWAIIVVLLIQNEKRRLLLLELRKNPALESETNKSAPISDAIRLQSGRSHFTLFPERIAYVAAEENYCSIHFINEDERTPLMVRSTFSRLIDQLPPDIFVQTHRSFVVNITCVTSIDASAAARAVHLANGVQLPISRARLAEIRLKFPDKLSSLQRS